MFDLCIHTLDLILCAFEDFVRKRAREADHQIRIAQLILQTSRGLYKDFGTTFVLLAQIFILAFHTFVPAQYDHAHASLLSRR